MIPIRGGAINGEQVAIRRNRRGHPSSCARSLKETQPHREGERERERGDPRCVQEIREKLVNGAIFFHEEETRKICRKFVEIGNLMHVSFFFIDEKKR